MRPPCEIVVWYIIPTIRSELAKELLNLGMKQKEISELLDITQPAVSQYISDKRGHGIKFTDETLGLIKIFAKDLMDGKLDQSGIISRICDICRQIKTEEIVCQLHKEKDNIPLNCNACVGSKAHQRDGKIQEKHHCAIDLDQEKSFDPASEVITLLLQRQKELESQIKELKISANMKINGFMTKKTEMEEIFSEGAGI